MMEFEGRKKISTELNIAPLIDVVFLLLLFFMLTANFVISPGIKLDLPSASSSRPHQEETAVVSVSRNGEIYLNENKVSLSGLPGGLKKILAQAEKKTVVIKADENVNFGLAVEVLDIAKQASAEGVVISTVKKEDVGKQRH
ncbi:MAG: biopolymer transporter ExbD [Candidatus Omnitrophica bacterium]|jgi:biopolymer transport protein ExbD|nr:biopolymer transporter ExbD [Candidatus Omnitrophota bacterium]